MTKDLGRLERVDLREIWETEAQGFTPWLADMLGRFDETFRQRIKALDVSDWSPEEKAQEAIAGQ